MTLPTHVIISPIGHDLHTLLTCRAEDIDEFGMALAAISVFAPKSEQRFNATIYHEP